jgi:transcriptional regulator with XRE-family HTH domain
MLDGEASTVKVSTGIDGLDGALDGLYWGDNVVWEVDGTSSDPFYTAIADCSSAFDTRIHISLGGDLTRTSVPGLIVVDAGPEGPFAQPADLLREIQRLCRTPSHRLLLFESLDSMVGRWGAHPTRGFFARCCPMLLEASAIAYWTMSAFQTPDSVRETVRAVTQCILRVDDRSVRVTKAEGRDDGVTGTVLNRRFEGGRPVLEQANVNGRVAASLRALRRSRALSQHDLAGLAGVTPSAISQAERAERGLSLSTVVRLAAALGITIDDLLRGEDAELYRIGRRIEDPQHASEQSLTLLGGEDSELRVDVVHLAPRESGAPAGRQKGSGIVAVASGMVAVEIGGQTPAVRHGEVLVADSERVDGWRNIGHGEATLFWIVLSSLTAARPHRSIS